MHALKGGCSVWAVAALLYSRFASASPAIQRSVAESELDPWVTVDPSGHPSTVTPVLTTINGVATTINPAPAILTASTTSTTGDSKPTTTSEAVEPTSTGGGSFQVCHNTGEFAPFCKPDNGSSVFVGETYYVTWDTSYFAQQNSTILIQANYVNASGGGPQAFQSAITPNSYGFISWTIDETWLKGMTSNNITLFITPLNPSATQDPESVAGPIVMVTKYTPPVYRQPKTPVPEGPSLYIALPTVFGFVILCLCGGYVINRKRRKIGLGNVMGRRNGYGVGKSRSQRMGLGKKKAGAIQLREQELTSGGQYRDVPAEQERGRPIGHARADSDALGSLAGTPTEERADYFSDGMRRQDQRRY